MNQISPTSIPTRNNAALPRPGEKGIFRTSKPAQQILSACACSTDQKGIFGVFVRLARIARQNTLPTDRAQNWMAELQKLTEAIRLAYCDASLPPEQRRALTVEPDSTAPRVFSNLHQVCEVDLDLPGRSRLDQLLLMSIATAAASSIRVTEALTWGFLQCLRALQGKSSTWVTLAANLPSTIDEIDALLKGPQPTPIVAFLTSLREILSLETAEVIEDNSATQENEVDDSEAAALPRADMRAQTPLAAAQSSESDITANPEPEPEHSTLTIQSRLHAAQFSSWAARSGIAHGWDYLPLTELQRLCPALVNDLRAPEPTNTFASLALIALLSATSPGQALNLTLVPSRHKDLPWIDLTVGCLTWSHAACTGKDIVEDSQDYRNTVWWPQAIVDELRRRATQHPSATHVIDLLAPHVSNDGGAVNLAAFNRYLQNKGDRAHKAEPARFAKSLPHAILAQTGSEVFAAWTCVRFEFVAPSSLHYFSPPNRWLHALLSTCYASLGLGVPVPMHLAPECRQGARALPPSLEALRACWSHVEQAIVRDLHAVREARDLHAAIEAFNSLSLNVHTSLVCLFGGRGTKPERITIASMTTCRAMFAFCDKETEVTSGWRLLPHTELSLALLDLYLHARERILFRLNLKSNTAAADSLLIQIDPDDRSIKPLRASEAAHEFSRQFNLPTNVFRHAWLTTMHLEGIDRWLIRAFSGHGSQRTSVFSEEMSVAPILAVLALGAVLERITPVLLGEGLLIKNEHARTFHVKQSRLRPSSGILSVGSKAAKFNPNGWIETITTRCLVDYSIVELARQRLLEAPPSSPRATVLLSALMIDGLPAVETAIDLATSRTSMSKIGSTAGAMWHRPHYLHDTFVTALPPTTVAAALIGNDRADIEQVISEAANWLRRIDRTVDWPLDNRVCINRLADACAAWRRIQLPPSLSYMSAVGLEAPALSINSMLRLAGKTDELSPLSFPPLDPGSAHHNLLRRNHNLDQLTQAINHWSDTGRPLGGQIARAQSLKAALRQLPLGTEVHEFCKRFIHFECDQIIGTHKGKLSSLATRWTALHPTLADLPLDSHLTDFDEPGWMDLVHRVSRWCAPNQQTERKSPERGIDSCPERAADALQRFIKAAMAFGCCITSQVWAQLSSVEDCPPRASASSTLLLPNEEVELRECAVEVLRDYPASALRAGNKIELQLDAPLRIVESSSLPVDSLTRSGTLIVPKTAFSSDKTTHSPRQVLVSESTLARVDALIEITLRQRPGARHLFRFDPKSISEDELANEVINQCIKRVTRDSSAVPYSMRGTAYMKRLWPNCTAIMAAFLQGQLTSAHAASWIDSKPLSECWTAAIAAGVAAGHGAVSPGFQHYASGWHLIHSIHMLASLTTLPAPGTAWIDMVGLSKEAHRKACYRSAGSGFDSWQWLASKADRTTFQPVLKAKLKVDIGNAPISSLPSQPTGTAYKLKYLVLLMLDVPSDQAAHLCNVSPADRTMLDTLLPTHDEIEKHRSRVNGTAQGRALDGDIKATRSQQGQDLIHWVATMRQEAFESLYALLVRAEHLLPVPIAEIRAPGFWKEISADLPANFCIHVRFGAGKHLTLSENAALLGCSRQIEIGKRDKNIGPMPRATIWRASHQKSKVDMARLTSIVRLAALARRLLPQDLLPKEAKEHAT